ncbi:2-hydroxychromene-2-carboxylate isomerase [Oceanococcus atlanticus]|uniref:2-hydroxychromene-2-carboxylate isomerase n=1 Tax=Oceanococcus atlanticus TaxID=1317117 RepID=A0A1Y1SBK6_9GAMM|nr:2-hydroxychromene-2-carboxylate isomerase [Oceanococcus atlanticus]ORE85280.1 2-hydroxychromene-2-carboxylate isomerase [Oceanococcus atlanticus]RZO84022.1 MAG: 2-hydroxychromene-2-carboxylate isomerase [Oceanococcus sp.]
MASVDFWFDYISHNAYLAWHGLKPIADAHNLAIIPQPVVFAGLLNHYGGKGPAELPAKSQWMLKNVLRKARQLDLTLRPPASHPFNPLLSLRATLAIDDVATRTRFIDSMFHAVWAESRDPSAAQTINDCATQAGCDGEHILAQANDPDIKDALHNQTREAIRRKVFGVPSILIGDELFWGYDDLVFMRQHLEGSDPLDTNDLQQWQRVRPSARR